MTPGPTAVDEGRPGRPPRPSGRPPRTEEQRRATRERLVTAAIGCLRTQGPTVSVDDLARAAGVSKPVLYDHFGDRAGLAEAVAEEVADDLERRVWASVGTTPTPETIARGVVSAVLRVVTEDANVYRFVVRDLLRSEAGLLANPVARRLHERATSWLAVGVAGTDGLVFPILADGLFGFLLAAVESWLAEGGLDRDELLDRLSAVVLAGLATLGDRR